MYKILFFTSLLFTIDISAVKTQKEKKAYPKHKNDPKKSKSRYFFANQPALQDLYNSMISTSEYKAYQQAQAACHAKCNDQLKADAHASGNSKFKVSQDHIAYNKLCYQACRIELLAYRKTDEYKLYRLTKKKLCSRIDIDSIINR